jgi:hypothetical protein
MIAATERASYGSADGREAGRHLAVLRRSIFRQISTMEYLVFFFTPRRSPMAARTRSIPLFFVGENDSGIPPLWR